MTHDERASCINTIELLRQVMSTRYGLDVIDDKNCDKIIEMLIDYPQWTPISEGLPEEDHWLGGSGRQFSDKVLVSIFNSVDKDEWVDTSYTIDGEWTLELSRDCKVIAWMPLPSPYREED